MNPNDPGLQALCWGGIILAVLIGAWPILKGILSRRKGVPPQDHLEERNQAAAMLIATYPYRRRVQSIYTILDKLSTLEKKNVPQPEITDTRNSPA